MAGQSPQSWANGILVDVSLHCPGIVVVVVVVVNSVATSDFVGHQGSVSRMYSSSRGLLAVNQRPLPFVAFG